MAATIVTLATAATASAATDGCERRSWTAGTTELCQGQLIYRDYVYDDYGADTGRSGAKSFSGFAPQTGDQRYSRDENSADLVSLRLRVRGDRLYAQFELNSLFNADSTVAALAIDTDADPSTGGGQWGDLGVASRGWDVLQTFSGGDPATNVISGNVPLPPGRRWRVQAVTAIAGGPVMNVAFRPDERGGWWEDRQAAALRAGSIDEFGTTVDVSDLRGRATRVPASGPGLHQRVYTSSYPVPPGEGVSYDGVPGRPKPKDSGIPGQEQEQRYNFLGRYQPYGVYVPPGGGPYGVQLALHGKGANHGAMVAQPGAQRTLGDALNRIIVVPLGRGVAGWYSDYSERDVLDVLDDVENTYDVDRDRVFTGGYSMGGYGALRLAALYPDRFAGFISWVGWTGDGANGTPVPRSFPGGAVGNVADFVGNLRYVPGALLYSGADELVHAWTSLDLASRFREAGNPYIFYFHPVAEHFSYALLDDWRKEAQYTKPLRRVGAVPRVTYRTADFLGNPALGIRHDRAYWVSEIRGRADGYQDVDLATQACGGSTPKTEVVRGAGPDPVPWVSEEARVVGSVPIGRAPVLSGTVRNVARARVDAQAACLASTPLTYDIETDGPARIELSDGRSIDLPAAGRHRGALGA